MELWTVLGQAATVAQLVGADAGGLISMIIQAAVTARQNKKECEQLARRVFMIAELLPHLQDPEVMQREEVRRPLTGLGDTLREAHELVTSCQGRSAMYQFVTAGRQADRFRDVQSRIDSYLLVLPIIIHIDNTRRLDRMEASRFCSCCFHFPSMLRLRQIRARDIPPGAVRSIEMVSPVELVGTIISISVRIVQLVLTAKSYRTKCGLLRQRVELIVQFLEELRKSPWMLDSATESMLNQLRDATGRALTLVESCQRKNKTLNFFKSYRKAAKFTALQKRITYIMLNINKQQFFMTVLEKLLQHGACQRLPQSVKEDLKSSITISGLKNCDDMSPDAKRVLEMIVRDCGDRNSDGFWFLLKKYCS